MDTIATLVKSIFQKESLEDCSLEELQSAARQYSFFTPAQFLLAGKLKSADENLYKEQLQKLSLHFSNPLWLDYLLNGNKKEIIAEIAIVEKNQEGMESNEEINIELQSEIPVQSEELVNESQNVNSFLETTILEKKQEDIETSNEEINIELQSEIPVQSEELVNEPQNVNSFDATNLVEEKQEDIETSSEEINIELQSEIPVQSEELGNEPQNVNSFDATSLVGEKYENVEMSDVEAPISTKSESGISELTEVGVNESEISIPALPDSKQEPAETELTFEPYHTVDYFASQGIKFVPEEKPADRFGQQLKSFTEWLKTMKRLPQTEAIKIPDVSSEEKVQQLADHSISEGEVVTETMAEVWLKQGNKQKAIETYNKLSLLNPGKSAYFASLIEQLKNS